MVNLYVKVLIFAVLIAILDRYVISDPEDVTLKESIPQVNLDMRQGSVLTDDGRLAHVGYQTQPWLKWNPSVLTSSFARKMRFKQWEFYALYSEDVTLCVAAADIGYAKNVFITIYEKGKDPVTIEEIIPPWIDANMTTSSLTGTTRFNTTDFFLFFFNNGSDMKSIVTQYKQGQIDINMMFVKAKSQDGLVYLGPMSKDKSQFFYSHKQYNYIVDGYLKINGKTHLFSKEQGVMD